MWEFQKGVNLNPVLPVATRNASAPAFAACIPRAMILKCLRIRSRAAFHAAVMTVLPGQFVGQILGYLLGWLRGYLWGISLHQARTHRHAPNTVPGALCSTSPALLFRGAQTLFISPVLQTRRSYLEVAVFCVTLAFHASLMRAHPFCDLAYFLGFNLLYFCSIAPNHDVAEVAIPAQTKGVTGVQDWGEAQVATALVITQSPRCEARR